MSTKNRLQITNCNSCFFYCVPYKLTEGASHSSKGCRQQAHCKHALEQSLTRRPASVDGTARRQFQATGQPVSRTQASDATTSRLPRYEAKCVQRSCFQWGSVPLRSDQGNEATSCQYIDTTRKAIDCATTLPLTFFI